MEKIMYDNLINEIKQRQLDRQDQFTENESETIKKIPIANWLHNPDSFNKEQFYKETIEFLFAIYSNAADIDKHLVAMLADTLETYIECKKVLDKQGYVIEFETIRRGLASCLGSQRHRFCSRALRKSPRPVRLFHEPVSSILGIQLLRVGAHRTA